MALIGADDLRNRLEAIRATFDVTASVWQRDAVGLMRQRIHSPTGRMRRSIHARGAGFFRRGRRGGLGAGVYADWRVRFIDKGTKPHDIRVKRKPGSPKVLTSGYTGARNAGTVFGRRAHVRGARKRPFIRKSAREALEKNPPTQNMIELWNAAGGQGRVRVARKRR